MAKNVERLQAREAKELIRREKQLGARSNKFYCKRTIASTP